MYNNINGFLSKKESVEKIVSLLNPDIIAFCETKKGGNIKKDQLKTYDIIEKTLKRGKEGLLIGIKKGTFTSVREITNSELKNIMAIRIEYPKVNLRVIIGHAPQETERKEIREEFFEELDVQVERCVSSGDELLILCDFNGRIGYEKGRYNVCNNSVNGSQLCDLILKYNLSVGNFHENCEGKWTRVQSMANGDVKKSVLDYIVSTPVIHKSIKSVLIDEEKIYCPYSIRKLKGSQKAIYSDHCAIIADIDIDPGRPKIRKEKLSGWKYCEDGFAQYKRESEVPFEVDISGPSATQIYSTWLVEFEKLLAKCFRRRTYKHKISEPTMSKRHKEIRELIVAISKRGKIQRIVAKSYQSRLTQIEMENIARIRAKRLEVTSSTLTVDEKFSPSGYWKLKKATKNGTRKDQGVSSILKENGVEVDGTDAIIDAYQEEFKNRLRNRPPKDGWEEYTDETNTVLRQWLQSKSKSTPPFTTDELGKVLKTLKNGTSAGCDKYPPELFSCAGTGVIQSILAIFNKIKELRDVPDQWDIVKIVTIYKKKGCKKDLKYYRGIFLTIIISKIFEKLIKARTENSLQEVNLFQAGSRKNRGPSDNVFLLRGVMDHFKFTKKPLLISSYDFEQAFDSLWLEDCILSLNELGVEKEYLQLIYNLNKKADVIVQTPYGPTQMFHTDPIVKQGTVLGPCLCSASTGEYCGLNPGVRVRDTTISSLVYVDDIIDLSSSVKDYLLSHENALLFKNRKKLTLSGTKCYSMVLNMKDDDLPTLTLERAAQVIVSKEIVYLGDIFNEQGNNDGLIKDRVKRGIKAMIAIAALISESELGMHRISVMLLLYRSLFLSTVLFNSSTWSNLRKKDIEALRKVQLKMLKRTVGVASSTSNAFIYLELGVLPIDYEIEKRQIMFLYRILQLEPTDPVYNLFCEMVKLNEDGELNWWSGVKVALAKFNLPSDLDVIKKMTRNSFTKLVKTSVSQTALNQLLNECQNQKKTADLHYKELKLQHYLEHPSPSHSKLVFKWRSKTLDLKTHSTYKYPDKLCRKCKIHEETPDHVLNCGMDDRMEKNTDIRKIDQIDDCTKLELTQMVLRINSFLEKVAEDN